MLHDTYQQIKKTNNLPRLPLEGSLDLTYRCNNNCRHCWLRIPADAKEKDNELSFGETKIIVNEAKAMGCRKWFISGGEPMLRPDFLEIFDYITRNSGPYSINTNGTFITPKIAKLLKRKGAKMVAFYGATAKVHDHITRNPGSFELMMRGFRYLKEAGAGFTVQLIPMKDNYYQFKEMVALAQSLSKLYRVGASWLYLSASGDKERNAEIMCQRLPPKEVIELNKPELSYEEWMTQEHKSSVHCHRDNNSFLFTSCIACRRDFHIDPYGKTTFCCFIKEPNLRYDLRKGSFRECWEKFIPSLANKIRVTKEYKANCGFCELRRDCRPCPVYGYLEHRDFNAKVEYLCAVAKENRKFKQNWQKNHRRYFKIADITIQVESDLPINEQTFHPKFKQFKVKGPGEDNISIRHHFSLPDLNGRDLGKEVYRKPPWAIYKNGGSWIYVGISPTQGDKRLHRVVVFNSDHSRARIYNDREKTFLEGGLHSLTLFPSDQILIARILADRQGCYLHSCGVNFKGKGLLFAGHSGVGKSTITKMLQGKAEILCDDRIIIRKPNTAHRTPHTEHRTPNTAHRTPHTEFRIYGTWSHGEVPDVSPNSAPLKAILFLEKAKENRIIPISDKKEVTRRLLACLIRPFVTVDWWDKTLSLIEEISGEIPCYMLRFDKSSKVVNILGKL